MEHEARTTALAAVRAGAGEQSAFTREIWELADPAWREHQSAARYVELLRGEGFDVETGTGGMPTAFERSGGGSGGERWIPPLLGAGFDPPIELRWPEYVETPRGRSWWIP